MVRCLHNTPPSPVHVHLLTSPSTSMLPVGSTLAFLTFLTTTLPPPNSQTIAAWTRTTTLVVSSAATVSGGGVNGYNIVPLRNSTARSLPAPPPTRPARSSPAQEALATPATTEGAAATCRHHPGISRLGRSAASQSE